MPAAGRAEDLAIALAEARDYDEFYAALEAALAGGATGSTYTILLVDPDSPRGEVARSSAGARGAAEFGPELAVALAEGVSWRACSGETGDLAAEGSVLAVAFASRLEYRGEPYGLFLVHVDRELSDGEAEFLNAVARLVGPRFVTIQLAQEAARRDSSSSAKLAFLHRLGEDLSGGLGVEEILSKILDVLLSLDAAQVSTVLRWKGTRFESPGEYGLPLEVALALRMTSGKPLVEHVLESGESLLVASREDDRVDLASVDTHRIENLFAVPLVAHERKLGVLLLANSPSRSPFPREVSEILAALAGMASQAIENSILHEESVQLKIAQRIQEALLPKTAPERPGFDLAGWSLACDATGGDYYDFVELDADRVAILIGDVSGHGLGAALYMMSARATLRTLLASGGSVDAVLARANDMLARDLGSDQFMTCFAGVADSAARRLSYSSAGHDAPFHYRPAEGRFLELDSTGFPLGIMGDSEFPMAEPVDLQAGDVLVFGTDGIWEAMDSEDNEYGRERLCEAIASSASLGAAAILDAIRADVAGFCGERERRDDWTLVVLKVAGTP